MIGSFDFYPIGGKGHLTEPVNACFRHLVPDETSTFAFSLAPVIFIQLQVEEAALRLVSDSLPALFAGCTWL